MPIPASFCAKLSVFYVFFAGITGNFCCLSQARQEFDAIDRPVRHFLDARSNTRDVEQQESKGHKTGHPDDLAEDLLECHSNDALAQSRKSKDKCVFSHIGFISCSVYKMQETRKS